MQKHDKPDVCPICTLEISDKNAERCPRCTCPMGIYIGNISKEKEKEIQDEIKLARKRWSEKQQKQKKSYPIDAIEPARDDQGAKPQSKKETAAKTVRDATLQITENNYQNTEPVYKSPDKKNKKIERPQNQKCKDQSPENSRRSLFWVFLVLIMIIGAGALYPYIMAARPVSSPETPPAAVYTEKPTDEKQPDFEEERKKLLHQQAYAIVQAACEKAANISEEIQELPLQKENLAAAIEFGDSRYIDEYKSVIAFKEGKIKEGISDYKGLLNQLSGIDQSIVENALGAYKTKLASNQKFVMIKVCNAVENHLRVSLETGQVDTDRWVTELASF